jgi:N-methylhydantoinase B
MNDAALNPVELEVARNRLESISEEVGTALIQTSYSPNIKDRRDCSAGIYAPDGMLISQAEHIPLHLGLMPTMIKNALASYGTDNLVDGDVLITNNPYLGGSHLPDMCVITPVFWQDQLVAVVANMAHHVDVGGITPGSMATHATEIFQEGVRVPPVKLFARGQLRQELLSVMLANIRTQDKTRGDIMAQVAANRLGERRIHELLAEWGAERFDESTRALVAYAARRTRAAIEQLPDGTGTFTDYLEHDGNQERQVAITVTVEVAGEKLSVDFRATDDQVHGAINCSWAVTEGCVAYVIKLLTDPTLPSNAGLMEPITVRTREGSLVAAQFPAPVANGNIQTSQRIVDALLGAFYQFAPEHVPAASSGSMSIMTIGGFDETLGQYFSYVETYGGGQGAMPDQDGASAIHTHMTNTRNTPCEVIEREYPLRVEAYQIAEDTGGSGQYRGGDGLIRHLTLTRGTAQVVAGTSRVTTSPWGLAGGSNGKPGRVVRHSADGEEQRESMTRFSVEAGEGITIQTAGGGGYGTM